MTKSFEQLLYLFGASSLGNDISFDEKLNISVTVPEQHGYNFTLSSVNIYHGTSSSGAKIAELDSLEDGYTMNDSYYSEVYIEVVWDMKALPIAFETNTVGSIKFESNNVVVTEGEYAQEITTTAYPPTIEGYNYTFMGLKIYGNAKLKNWQNVVHTQMCNPTKLLTLL